MTQALCRIDTKDELPSSTSVVIIGGGIVGISAALTLAERNIPVILLEKGHIAGEQSSRNLGWIRKTSRASADVPLALAADALWKSMPSRISQDVGYRQNGILFLADDDKQMAMHESWLDSVKDLSLGSQLLSTAEIASKVPGGSASWRGGVYTATDGNAEPALAAPAMAEAAISNGAVLLQHCAVRSLSTSNGRVTGVVTEKGEIDCEHVILAAGAWSRRFLGNHGVSLPTLPLICSVLRTQAMDGPTDIAVGAPNFSFRKHIEGGYIITQRGALDAPLCLDHLRLVHHYLEPLRTQRHFLRPKLGRYFLDDLKLARRWKNDQISPFERIRTMNPAYNKNLNAEALSNLRKAWPVFKQATVEESWAGLIDVTPDSNPVIDQLESLPGLTLATGFSGHGFGTGPAAGQLAADIATNTQPLVDPTPYRFDRL